MAASLHAAAKSVERVHLSSDMMDRMAIVRVHLVPNAKSDRVAGEYGGAIKITIRAPAVDGKANAALIRFLARQLKVTRHSIVLEHGQKSRDKVIRIDRLTEEDVRRRIGAKD
jgi:uncharacterized protein (TIGR00251 family)